MRRILLIGTLSLLSCLNHLSCTSSMSLHLGFSSHFILDLFCSDTLIILFLFFQIHLIVEFTRPNSPHTSAFFFPFSISRSNLTFSSMLKTFFLFCLWLSPLHHFTNLLLTPGAEKMRETSSKLTATTVIFQTWNLCSYLKMWRVVFSTMRRRMNSQNSLLLVTSYWNQCMAMLSRPRETPLCMLY